jgi:hypothetical protein
MISKVVLVAVTFVYINAYGTVNPVYFSGFIETPDGGMMSSSLPTGVHPRDIAPDKIRLEHINLVLEIYEKNLRQGTLLGSGVTMDTLYLFSFVGDKRFSSLIYDQYAERLFEEFGDKEAPVVLLYYQTGGSLEKLRALYKQPIDDVVKKAIEVCFFDASVGLVEEHEQDVADSTPQPLSVTLSTKFRTRKYYASESGDELFGSPAEGSEGGWTLHESTTDKRDLYITYENTTKNLLIRIKVPRRTHTYQRCWCEFNVIRNGGVPVLASGYLRPHEHEKQFITLYPGDQYIRKMDVNFSVTFPGVLMPQFFSDFGKEVVRLGVYWVGNAGDDFRVTLNYTCNYITAESVDALNQSMDSDWKAARSNPLDLDYVHAPPCSTQTSKERDWERMMKRVKRGHR